MPYIQPAARGVPLGGVHRDQCHHGIASSTNKRGAGRQNPERGVLALVPRVNGLGVLACVTPFPFIVARPALRLREAALSGHRQDG